MAPNSAAVTAVLRQVIYYHIDNSAYANALFFAERLAAQDPRSAESAHLLALCHLRLGDARSAYEISKPAGVRGISLGCAWVFAQASYSLDKLKDAITALEKAKGLWAHRATLGRHGGATRAPVPDAAAVSCLLGKLHRGLDDKKRAVACFEDALKLNPFMWDAFTNLCDMGIVVKVPNIFRTDDGLVRAFSSPQVQYHQHHQHHQHSSNNNNSGSSSSNNNQGVHGQFQHYDQVADRTAESKENPGLYNEWLARKATASSLQSVTIIGPEPEDPFSSQPSSPCHGSSRTFSPDLDPAELEMSRPAVGMAPSGLRRQQPSHHYSGNGSDGIETPTGPSSTHDAHAVPAAPSRRSRTAPSVDASYADAPPPRMIYRLGSKKTGRAQDRAQQAPPPPAQEPTFEPATAEASGSSAAARPHQPSIPAPERKRTISGHPVPPRGAPEEPSAPQRRSARLNMFKPATSSAAAAAAASAASTSAPAPAPAPAPAGSTARAGSRSTAAESAAAARESKKAKHPAGSRIMRPGSVASSVGRVVSGNRKPAEDNVDMDHGEGSRVREAAAVSQQQQPLPPPPLHPTPQSHPHLFPQYQSHQQPQHQPHPQQQHPLPTQPPHRQPEPETAKTEEALKWALDLVKRMAVGYFSLSQFRCADSLHAFGSLPKTQIETAWVQAQMGRAHYEQAAYAEADKFYRRVRVLAPTRLDGMEVYSTILWHLKREAELSFLAHELIDSSWYAPQAWCALGNCWSLSRDPEQAIRCFRRATQLDPTFAYAYTLQGHEHVLAEEYDKALTAYRHAISADRRHYNAYYGIGRVLERLGSYDKALAHFQAASVINPTNAVLTCCLGTVFERQKQMPEALKYYTRAVELAPRAALTRYKRARALLAVGHYEAAQQELEFLKDLAPDEARVHFMLGKLYKSIGRKGLAVRHLSNALALDPKAAPQIKEAIESFEDDIGMDDSVL